MAGHAVRSKCQEVFCGKGLVNLQMAIAARILIERGSVSFIVAILTGKWGPI
jgi:hypothetical protein